MKSNQTLSTLFRLFKAKATKEGKVPIYVRIIIDDIGYTAKEYKERMKDYILVRPLCKPMEGFPFRKCQLFQDNTPCLRLIYTTMSV